jgi:hypothetical protein
MRILLQRLFLLVPVLTILAPGPTRLAAQSTTYGVLFETFTNSYINCPATNDFYNTWEGTLTRKGTEVVHLCHHFSNLGDPMAQSDVGSTQAMNEISGGANIINVNAVNRQSFSSSATAKLSSSQAEWENEIDEEAGKSRSAELTLTSATWDTSNYVLTAHLDVTSDVAFTNVVKIRYAIVQDGVPYKQCGGTGPSIHNDVVRYVTYGDSILQLQGKPAGTTVHVTYYQRIGQMAPGTAHDTTFKPAKMRLIAFIEESTGSDFYVTTAGQVLSNFETLPLPTSSLKLSSTSLDGQAFNHGATASISWLKANVNSVIVSYSLDNGATWSPITTVNDKNDVEHLFWTVPDSSTSTGKIKISSADGTVTSIEPATFSITAAPHSLSIVSPVARDTFNIGQPIKIQWNESGLSGVTILYTSNGAMTWDTIVKNYTVSTIYTDTAKAPATNQAQYQIIPLGVSDVAPLETGEFVIRKVLSVSQELLPGVSGLKVYPNPVSSNNLHLSFSVAEPGVVIVSLYDLLGRALQHVTLDQQSVGMVALDLSVKDLLSGTYIVRAASEKGFVSSTRFTLQR